MKSYSEIDKKIINVSILERGNVLCIYIDNYFDGQLVYEDGIPVTSKKDKNIHGFGINSIKTLARKYGGEINIHDSNNTFSLQVIIPT